MKSLLLSSLLVITTEIATAQNHLLLSEVAMQPNAAEFIEIYNPTVNAISLDNYYLTGFAKSFQGGLFYFR